MSVPPSSGTGVGSPGAPQQPTYYELKDSQIALQQAVNLYANTLEVALTQLDRNFKYEFQQEPYSPSRPVLANIRLERAPIGPEDNTWIAIRAQLEAKLSEGIRLQMAIEHDKPYQERNPSFIVFDSFLDATAQSLAQMMKIREGMVTASQEISQQINLVLRLIALGELVSYGFSVVGSARAFLEGYGRGYPHFEKANYFAENIANLLSHLDNLHTRLRGDEDVDADMLTKLSDEIGRLKQEYSTSYLENDFQSFGIVLEWMEILTTAQKLDPGAGSLLIGLSSASLGSIGRTSFFGESINTLNQGVVNGILNTFLPQLDRGKRDLVAAFTPLMMSTLTVLFSTIREEGLGSLPSGGGVNRDDANFFALNLVFGALSNSHLIQDGLLTLIQSKEAKKEEEVVSHMLEQWLLMISVLAAQAKEQDKVADILEGQQKDYRELLDEISQRLVGPHQTVEEATTSQINVYLQIARTALEKDNLGAFLGALSDAVRALNISEEGLGPQLSAVHQKGHALGNTIREGSEEGHRPPSGIYTAG